MVKRQRGRLITAWLGRPVRSGGRFLARWCRGLAV